MTKNSLLVVLAQFEKNIKSECPFFFFSNVIICGLNIHDENLLFLTHIKKAGLHAMHSSNWTDQKDPSTKYPVLYFLVLLLGDHL